MGVDQIINDGVTAFMDLILMIEDDDREYGGQEEADAAMARAEARARASGERLRGRRGRDGAEGRGRWRGAGKHQSMRGSCRPVACLLASV